MQLLGQFEELTATNVALMARLSKLEEEKRTTVSAGTVIVPELAVVHKSDVEHIARVNEMQEKKTAVSAGTVMVPESAVVDVSSKSDSASMVEMMASVIEKTAAMHMHPKLHSLQREDIRKFKSAWVQYERQVPMRARCRLQFVVEPELVDTIIKANKVSEEDCENMSAGEAMDTIFETWRVNSATDFETRLKEKNFTMNGSCEIPDLAAYNREWDIEVKFAGLQHLKPAFSKRRLAKLYCAGLRPAEMSAYVSANDPESVDDAKQQAQEALPLIRLQIKAKEAVMKSKAKEAAQEMSGTASNHGGRHGPFVRHTQPLFQKNRESDEKSVINPLRANSENTAHGQQGHRSQIFQSQSQQAQIQQSPQPQQQQQHQQYQLQQQQQKSSSRSASPAPANKQGGLRHNQLEVSINDEDLRSSEVDAVSSDTEVETDETQRQVCVNMTQVEDQQQIGAENEGVVSESANTVFNDSDSSDEDTTAMTEMRVQCISAPKKEVDSEPGLVETIRPALLVRLPFRVSDHDASRFIDVPGFCDTGANVNYIHPKTLTRLKLRGLQVLERPLMQGQIVKLGSQAEAHDMYSTITHMVKLRGHLLLPSYEMEVEEEPFYIWHELREECVFGLDFLRKYRLLSYMESGVLPMSSSCSVTEVEAEVLPGRFDRFDNQFAAINSQQLDLSNEEVEKLVMDPTIVDPNFPLIDELRDLLRALGPKLFGAMDANGMDAPPVHLKVKPGYIFKRQPSRVLPAALMPRVKLELDKWVADGLLRPVDKPTRAASPLVVAPKANGGIRVCIDLREVNKGLEHDHFTLPNYKELFPH